MRKLRLLVFVLVILRPGLTFGQVAITAKIAGVVTDSSGAPVPNATVAVKSTALMVARTTNTGADGAYLFDLLPPGTYEVTVTYSGFKGFSETGIVLNAGFTATVNAKLQVGEVTETVRSKAYPWSTCRASRRQRRLTRRCCKTYQAVATRGPRWPKCQEPH